MINIKAKFIAIIEKHLQRGMSAQQLALSISIAIFIALSPFLFFHTIMIAVACWFLGLNFILVYGTAHLINNPWTMAIIYGMDHAIGYWLLSSWGATRLIESNPFWIEYFNAKVQQHIGITVNFSLWSFVIGGSLLAFGFSIMLYPIIKRLINSWLHKNFSGGLL